MRNLVLLARSDFLIPMLLVIIAIIWMSIDLIVRIKSHVKERSAKKETRSLKTEIIAFSVFLLGAVWVVVSKGADYYVDYRDNSPITVMGIVDRMHFNDDDDYYEAVVLTDTEISVVLKIHPSLLDEYKIVEGQQYKIQYFPRTYALCSLLPLDND